jgi:hypothetical protein
VGSHPCCGGGQGAVEPKGEGVEVGAGGDALADVRGDVDGALLQHAQDQRGAVLGLALALGLALCLALQVRLLEQRPVAREVGAVALTGGRGPPTTRVADRDAARAQLEEILGQSERPNVTVRVIPFDVDGFAGANTSMLYAGGSVPQLDTALARPGAVAGLHPPPGEGAVKRDPVAEVDLLRGRRR